MKKFLNARPYADPEAAARKLIEIANGVEAVQDARIFVELVNWPFLVECEGTVDEYRAGIRHAVERGWIIVHESGTYLKFTNAGAAMFA